MAQLPFFACSNVIMDQKAQKDISRFMYVRNFNVPAYKGSYGEQPKNGLKRVFTK